MLCAPLRNGDDLWPGGVRPTQIRRVLTQLGVGVAYVCAEQSGGGGIPEGRVMVALRSESGCWRVKSLSRRTGKSRTRMPGGVPDRVDDRGGGADDADLPDALAAIGLIRSSVAVGAEVDPLDSGVR